MSDAPLQLRDWRRRVTVLYREVRAMADVEQAWHKWRGVWDAPFATHPCSPSSPPPAPRKSLPEVPPAPSRFVPLPAPGAWLWPLGANLVLYWVGGYGGGVFLPLRGATAGAATFGGGRYLIDTREGADPGCAPDGRLVLDFNSAYNSSCAYSVRWSCPLTPPTNHLSRSAQAGARAPDT